MTRAWGARGLQMKIAAAVGVTVLVGMGSLAAAASSGTDPTEPTVQPAPSDAPAESPPAPEAEIPDAPPEDPDPSPPLDDPDTPDGDEAAAPEAEPSGCLTHGRRVSAVARSTPPGPGHGAAVRAAAHDHTGECTPSGEPEPEVLTEAPDIGTAPAPRPTPPTPDLGRPTSSSGPKASAPGKAHETG